MSKAALDMSTRSMASLLGPNIRVNSVNPGPVRTNIFHDSKYPDNFMDLMSTQTAQQRIGLPVDIANLIDFLASDASKNMTGSIIISDSGFLTNDSSKSISPIITAK